MKPCEYLYGVKSLKSALKDALYADALKMKIQLSDILVRRLLKVPMMERDGVRVNDSLSSQRFNRKLLAELK